MIYLDSCILIYALEDRAARGERVRAALARTSAEVATSPLALHECLVGPLKDQDLELRDRYIAFFEQLHSIELSAEIFMRAAELRAMTGLRTPDALHLAAAQRAGCEALWTNDLRFARAAHGLAVNILA